MPIGFDDLVHDVMNDWPATIRIFLDFKMGCVGCPIACFHTVDDACGEHHVDRAAFLAALREVVESCPEQPSEKIVQGPAIVVGMFSGEGMHGARDAPKVDRRTEAE